MPNLIDISTGKPFTRRSALKGLAAIIAAGVAPSVSASTGGLRRGLGARLGMMGGKKCKYLSLASEKSYIWSGFSYPTSGNLRVITKFRLTEGYTTKQYQCAIGNAGDGITRFDPAAIQNFGSNLWFGAESGEAYPCDLSDLKYHIIDYRLNIDNQTAYYAIDGRALFNGARSLPRKSNKNELMIMCRSMGINAHELWFSTFLHLAQIDIYKNGVLQKSFIPDVVSGIAGLSETVSGNFLRPSIGAMAVGEEET